MKSKAEPIDFAHEHVNVLLMPLELKGKCIQIMGRVASMPSAWMWQETKPHDSAMEHDYLQQLILFFELPSWQEGSDAKNWTSTAQHLSILLGQKARLYSRDAPVLPNKLQRDH